jgi:mRNA deadenylase 3'-5' endonuclease subunit Ccr4
MNFKGTLDYIFYTTPNLKVVSLMELVDEEEVKDGALPSRTRSSDHIAIATKFKLHQMGEVHETGEASLPLVDELHQMVESTQN